MGCGPIVFDVPDPILLLAAACGVLAGSGLPLIVRRLRSREAPAVPVQPPADTSADERALREFVTRYQALEQRVEAISLELARRPTMAELEEAIASHVKTRFTALRAEVEAIAEQVDSNLSAVDRTRRRIAARTAPEPQQPQVKISPAALRFLQGGVS